MRAVQLHAYGGPEVLRYEEVPDQHPRPGEVTVALKGASVNRLDLRLRAGQGRSLSFPWTLGLDGAGIVQEIGEGVTDVAAGQEVILSSGLSCGRCDACLSSWDNRCPHFGQLGVARPGTYAEMVRVLAANVALKPPSVSFTEAAAFPLVYTTVWHMAVVAGQIKDTDWVLVHAAGSGIGSAAIQIARLFGARVMATTGSDEKLALARNLGAEAAINYATQDFVAEAKRWTDGRGVDVVLDSVGGDILPKSLEAMAIGGRYVTCGATAGSPVSLDVRSLYARQQSIHGVYMGRKTDFREALKRLAQGHLRPVIYKTVPLRDAPDAHRILEDRRQFGKVVLVM